MNFTTDQIKYLISLQNDSHRQGVIRSLFKAGVLRSETGWAKEGYELLKNAVPVCELRNGLNRKIVKYKVYAKDQTKVKQ